MPESHRLPFSGLSQATGRPSIRFHALWHISKAVVKGETDPRTFEKIYQRYIPNADLNDLLKK